MSLRLVLLAVGWFAGWRLLARVEPVAGAHPEPGAGENDVTRAAVVVPARDEEANIGALLATVTGRGPAPASVVVVDDGSTDATAAVAAAGGATVVAGTDPPPGWTGKAWACHRGARAAEGDPLVFLDADVRLGPGGLAAVLDRHTRLGGLVSVQPFHDVPRPYEKLALVFAVVSLMGVAPGRRGTAHGAFGPCLVTGRADYAAAGGHAAAAGSVVDDLALARAHAAAGRPVHVFTGGPHVRYRMYPDGPGQLVEGWTKNLASGAGGLPPARLALTVAWVAALAAAGAGLVDGVRGDPVALAAYGAFAVQLHRFGRRLGGFGWGPALLHPLATALFTAVFLRSLWRTAVRRRVRWRGRDVVVGRS